MDNLIERGMLYDFYGDLLTEHQQKIYSAAVFDDLSLGELSEETGVTRQGIHDLIKRCDKLLEGYEEKLGLIRKYHTINGITGEISLMIEDRKDLDPEFKQEIRTRLKKILEEL